jgi:2-octaprenyl-6-methoxyphenol hydroxylase
MSLNHTPSDNASSADAYQVVVVGAGLVGAAAALALSRQGLRVALIERQPPREPEPAASPPHPNPPPQAGEGANVMPKPTQWDTRIYAISPDSRHFLESLGAWKRLDAARVEPVYRMQVQGDADGSLLLDAYQAGVAQLAAILENGRLQAALWQAVESDGGITLLCPGAVAAIEWGSPYSRLVLADGAVLHAELVVGADGADSRIRALAGIQATVTPYRQSGVVANFACEKAHRGTAFQWFQGGNIMAWLPLPGQRMSLVWSTAEAEVAALLALDAPALASRVAEAGGGRLGELQLLTPPAAFPLRLIRVPRVAMRGLVLIGDAAHGMHPLAGQGVNTGFGDAEALASVLSQRGCARCGDPVLLQRHARLRAEPVARMQAMTHGLHYLFGQDSASWLRNTGMNLLDRLGPVKTALIRETADH